MKKRLIAGILAAVLLLSMAACGAQQPVETTAAPTSAPETTVPETAPETTEAEPETILFTDDCGREVPVPAEVNRIVPSSSLAQIILFALAPEKLAGLSSSFHKEAKGLIPDEYWDLPEFGRLTGSADLNVEELALTQPDLLIDIGERKKSIGEDLDTLQAQTKIPSVFISASLESLPQTFRTLGKLIGAEERAEELAAFCEKVLDRTHGIMDKVGEENRVKILYVLGDEGLNVLAKGSYHAEILDLLTDNLAVVEKPVSKGSGNEVTMEQISLWNPEFVIFATRSIYDTVKETPVWNEIDAIQNDRYVEVPDNPYSWLGMPPSAQRYLGLVWLPAVLYPEYCDYDVREEVSELYRLLYHCELTDEQYHEITANAFVKE